eukprot:221547-Pelagomonas_calceolata.AAC.1
MTIPWNLWVVSDNVYGNKRITTWALQSILKIGKVAANEGIHGVKDTSLNVSFVFLKVLHSMRGFKEVRSSTSATRQLHELNIQNHHIRLVDIKYCEDTRPGAQEEASEQQHSEQCKRLQGAETTLHKILLSVGGCNYTAHTLDQF